MPPVTIVATLKGINGKPSDPGASPMVDIALRTEATPELLQLFGSIGQIFDLTFARRGEQLPLFDSEETFTDEDDLTNAVVEQNGVVEEAEANLDSATF